MTAAIAELAFRPEAIAFNPARPLIIAATDELAEQCGANLRTTDVVVLTAENFQRAKGSLVGRQGVELIDGGNWAWRADMEGMLANIGCTAMPPRPVLKPLNISEVLQLALPPRDYVLRPILDSKSLMMIHAARGTGKTFFVYSLAYAIATGAPWLGWETPRPRRVLVLDGEMAMQDIQQRLSSIALGFEVEPPPENLVFLAADHQVNGLPDPSSAYGLELFQPFYDQADVVVFDNLSTLFTGIRENENDDQFLVNSLLLRLRREGKCVIIVHHSGKNGNQRGGSRREDPLNTVIGLKRPDDCDGQDGCVFNVVFEKNRGFCGKDAASFRAVGRTDPTTGAFIWQRTELEDKLAADVLELQTKGMTQREIAKELSTSPATVNRILARSKP